MPFFALSLIVQVALVVHILKTGRNTSWVFIVMFFPIVGTIAYIIVELWPEWTNSSAVHQAKRKLSDVVNPDRDLRQASQNLAVADTIQNAMALAEECLEKSRFAEARLLYERSLRGVHAEDPHLLLGLARSQYGMGDFAGTVQTLDRLKDRNPGHKSAEGHLLYARAQEGLGKIDDAIHEYQTLVTYYPGPEPACRLGLIFKARGYTQEARALFGKVVHEGQIAGKHYNTLHQEWVAMAKREYT